MPKNKRHKAVVLALTLGLCISALLIAPKLIPRLWAYWQDRAPRITTLTPAKNDPIDAQTTRYAGLADLGDLLVGGGQLRVLGNPAAERYPDCDQSVARNPWDLRAFAGGLYLGLGNEDNRGPSANSGPVPVVRYDPSDGTFRQEVTLPEEQLDRFYLHDGELWVPGADARQSWRWGSLYRRDASGRWTQYRSLPRTVHAYALAWHQGHLFAGVSVTEAVPEGVGSERYGSAVAVIPSRGPSNGDERERAMEWSLIPLGGWRILDFLKVEGQLYATDIFPGPAIQRWLDDEQRQSWHAPVYELEPSGASPLPHFLRRSDLDARTLFPDTPQAGKRAAIVARAVAWGERAAYLGVFASAPDSWSAHGAYLADSLRPGAVRVRRIPLPEGALAFDLRLDGEELQVLFAVPDTNTPDADGALETRWRNTLWSSRDGQQWETVLSFSAQAPARAVERLNDNLYFGLGSVRSPAAGVCMPMDELAGTVLRWQPPDGA